MDKRIELSIAFVAGSAIAGLATYFITRKKMEEQYQNELQFELDGMRTFYEMRKDGARVVVKNASEAAKEDVLTQVSKEFYDTKLEDLGYTEKAEESEVKDESIFDKDVDESEVGEPIEDPDANFYNDRDYDEPYVISVTEFHEEMHEFEKDSLTYYEGDDTLCDMSDRVITDIDGSIGTASLLRFGDHSDDRNTVFVRNVSMATDFEVTRDSGEYTDTVLGLPSEKPVKVRKMRHDE